MEDHEKVNRAGSWAAAGGPSRPTNIGLHRLNEDTVLMTDTCNGARCTKRLLMEAVMETIKTKMGLEAWNRLTEEERNAKYRVYRGDCWQHLRNILIAAMATAGNEYVKGLVQDDLDTFSSFERIEVNETNLIRGAFKQFHHKGEYEKGRGRCFEADRKSKHKDALFIPFERAVGNRQDLSFDGCVPLYWNRIICLEFIIAFINCPKSENKLDKSLYTTLSCNEFVALLRANSLWKYIFSEPFRWLAGKGSKLKGFSIFKMSRVLDCVDVGMQKIRDDARLVLDPDYMYDMFADLMREMPEFASWRQQQLEKKTTAEDGKTEHYLKREMLHELRTPAPGSGNAQVTDVTLAIIKVQATRALEKLYDPKIALADKLSSQDGVNSFGRNMEAHARLEGVHVNNDPSENKFAIADHVARTHRGISVLNLSGIVQQRGTGDFERPLTIISDRRKRKSTGEQPEQPQPKAGFFWSGLTTELRASMVRVARRELPAAIKAGRADKESHDTEELKRREESINRQLNVLVEKCAEAKEKFDEWVAAAKEMTANGIKQWKEKLEARLKTLSIPQQIQELRRQIEMRTLGLGWTQFSTKWGFFSDEKQHTWERLHSMLVDDIIPHELALKRKGQLPKEAVMPQLTPRLVKTLGTVRSSLVGCSSSVGRSLL